MAHIEGAGAEQSQQGHLRLNLMVSLAGDPKPETRQGLGVTPLHADVPSPQQFTSHPAMNQLIDDQVGDFVFPHLPGRVPPAGWDGEPGAAAPTAGWL